MLFAPSGEGRKRQKKGEKGRSRPISRKGTARHPFKPPFVTPPFAAARLCNNTEVSRASGPKCRRSPGAFGPVTPKRLQKVSRTIWEVSGESPLSRKCRKESFRTVPETFGDSSGSWGQRPREIFSSLSLHLAPHALRVFLITALCL